MNSKTYSAKNVFQGLNEAHHRFLEAIYHLWDESLIRERRALLEEAGTTFQVPFLESTPKYPPGPSYGELAIPRKVQEVLAHCADLGDVGVFHHPYHHQGEALEAFVKKGKSLIVASGTGSGKTECFLFPLLSTLAMEGIQRPATASKPGFRALVLYPMNALVNDQLGVCRT